MAFPCTNLSYETLFTTGDHIILELKEDDIFQGDFLEGGKDRIDLINTTQHNNPNDVLSGTYTFYRGEIRDICKFKDCHQNQATNSTNTPSKLKIINMTSNEYDRLKDLTKKYIYIDKADSRYYDAITKIKRLENIGIVSLGPKTFIKIFVVCTPRQVYLFNLQDLKSRKFYPELKEILESNFTCKIMHNAGPIINMLNKYKICCENIFDTQVVDLIYRKNRLVGKEPHALVPSSIAECLVRYFSFPTALLKDAMEVSGKQWNAEYLEDPLKVFASQLCVYLIPLKSALLKKLFSRVYESIDNVHNYWHNLSDEQYSQKVNDSIVDPEVDKLIPSLRVTSDSNAERVYG